MDRTEQMREYLKPYLTEWLRKRILQVSSVQEDSLLSLAKSMFQDALAHQQQDPVWKPSCLCLLHLLTGLIRNTQEYQLLLSNTEVYLDGGKRIAYWRPAFIRGGEAKSEELKKRLMGRFLRINEYELSYISHWISYEDRKLIGVYWREQAERICRLEEFQNLDKDRPFYFFFGDYMGELGEAFQYKEER